MFQQLFSEKMMQHDYFQVDHVLKAVAELPEMEADRAWPQGGAADEKTTSLESES